MTSYIATMELRDGMDQAVRVEFEPGDYIDACLDAVELAKELEYEGYRLLASQDHDNWYGWVPRTQLKALVKVEAVRWAT